MILARCPHCATTFRATPEVLKQRAGKVRCGKCRQVFNALDHLVAEAPTPTPAPTEPPFALTPPPGGADPEPAPPAASPDAEAPELLAEEAPADDTAQIAITPHDETTAPAEANASAEAPAPGADPLLDDLDHGQIAARETREAPGYSKWAEGTLSSPIGSFAEPHHTGWLAVVTAVILALMLLVQSVHYWRMEIAMAWPDARPWLEEACRSANCTVPYPRDASQINLEASELQIDPERGNMLVLNMTLKNRAPFAQEFPAIELTLTDVRDNVVVRRILAPAEWLPDLDRNASKATSSTISTPPAFPAQKEIAARLWIDAKDTGAVGYRLYVFYP